MSKKKVKKGIITVYIPANLIDKVKNTVYWTPGLTIASFAEKAIADAVMRWKGNVGMLFRSVDNRFRQIRRGYYQEIKRSLVLPGNYIKVENCLSRYCYLAFDYRTSRFA